MKNPFQPAGGRAKKYYAVSTVIPIVIYGIIGATTDSGVTQKC